MKNTVKQHTCYPKTCFKKYKNKQANNTELSKHTKHVNPEYYVLRVSISKIR